MTAEGIFSFYPNPLPPPIWTHSRSLYWLCWGERGSGRWRGCEDSERGGGGGRVPELGSYLCWIPEPRRGGSPCTPGFWCQPPLGASQPRLERRHQEERSWVSDGGLSGPPACLAERWASLLWCPFLHRSQTPRPRRGSCWGCGPRGREVRRLGAQVPSGPGKGVGGALGRGPRWVGESRNCVVALLPQLLLLHGYLLPLLPRFNILPISVFLLGG